MTPGKENSKYSSNAGRPPKAATPGFLSDTRRELLRMPKESRNAAPGWREHKSQITKKIPEAIKDLTLVLEGLDQADLEKTFLVKDVGQLIATIAAKLGSQSTEMGPYYQVLAKAIECGINKNKEKENEVISLTITTKPKYTPSIGGINVMCSDSRDLPFFKPK